MIEFIPSRTVALSIGSFDVHWYGLMYLFGFVLAFLWLPRLERYRHLDLTRDDWSNLISWGIIGIVVGGRLGHVFFYEPMYYLAHPLEVFAVWNGGMASHGGMIGAGAGILYALRGKKWDPLSIGDLIVVPVAFGLAIGRLGNLINYEIFGNFSTLPWAIDIPGVEGLRHPTQIYAFLKNVLIGCACYIHLRTFRPVKPGQTAALFLMLYAVLRFTVEIFREQDYAGISLWFLELTRGQFLTLGVLAAGIGLWLFSAKRRVSPVS